MCSFPPHRWVTSLWQASFMRRPPKRRQSATPFFQAPCFLSVTLLAFPSVGLQRSGNPSAGGGLEEEGKSPLRFTIPSTLTNSPISSFLITRQRDAGGDGLGQFCSLTLKRGLHGGTGLRAHKGSIEPKVMVHFRPWDHGGGWRAGESHR